MLIEEDPIKGFGDIALHRNVEIGNFTKKISKSLLESMTKNFSGEETH